MDVNLRPRKSHSSNQETILVDKTFSVVLPCLNEERTIGNCIEEILATAHRDNLNLEIIVADNGSTDRSREIARKLGAKVIEVETKGYGAALRAGISASSNDVVIMADADMSYNFSHITKFYEVMVKENLDIVIGNRFEGGIHRGAMPKLHRYLGNPVLSFIGRKFFDISIRDFHCGMRAVRLSSFSEVKPVTTGMEFATEMIARFSVQGFRFGEVPTELRKDGRDRKPHLRSFPDGWRHLKMMLLYSPEWLQIYPSVALISVSLYGILSYFFIGSINLFFARGSLQTSVFFLLAFVVGIQILISGITASCIAFQKGVTKYKKWEKFEKLATSPWCTSAGILLTIFAALTLGVDAGIWIHSDFKSVDAYSQTRATVLSAAVFFFGTAVITLTVQLRQLTSRFW